jgi:hypothetical protein
MVTMEEFDEYKTGSHEIGKDTLSLSAIDSETGAAISFEAFRSLDDDGERLYISQLRLWDNESAALIQEEVIMPKKLHVVGQNTLKKFSRHKGAILVAGSIVVTLAAGRGILVKRHKSEDN